jgi:hypothetical protein
MMSDDHLPQGDTAVVAGHLTVSIYLQPYGLKPGYGFFYQQTVLENSAAQRRFLYTRFNRD